MDVENPLPAAGVINMKTGINIGNCTESDKCHMRVIMAVLVSLALIGCTPNVYVPPVGTDTAILTFQNAASSGSVGLRAFKVAEDCSGGKLLFEPKTWLSPGEQVGIKIKANHAFSFFFEYRTSDGLKYCLMPATFTPKQSESYIARFTSDKLNCYADVVTASAAGETKEPTFRLRKWRTPMLNDGSFCE